MTVNNQPQGGVMPKHHRFSPFSFFFLILCAAPATAIESVASPDKQKQELIEIMKGVRFVPQLGKDDPFCKAFYEDFKTQKHIEHIPPIVKVDKYDDLTLKPYQDKCPKLKMHKTMAFEPRDIEVAGEPKDEEDAESRAVGIYYGMGNFQLYKVDINNHPEDGDELILYYEGVQDKKYDRNTISPATRLYRRVNLAKCEVATIVQFDVSGSPITTRSGIVRYKGKNVTYVLRPASYLELNMYSEKLKRIAPSCAYDKPR